MADQAGATTGLWNTRDSLVSPYHELRALMCPDTRTRCRLG